MGRNVNLEEMVFEAIGLSNMAYDRPKRKMYSVQFYDYDYHDPPHLLDAVLNTVSDIFPYDCLTYQTKHGLHFISFAICEGTAYTKARALEMTTFLGNQDYWCSQRDLILRISPKWKCKERDFERVSFKPRFNRLVSHPSNCLISRNHLEFYRKFMNLPERIYNLYSECPSLSLDLKLYFYNARD